VPQHLYTENGEAASARYW